MHVKKIVGMSMAPVLLAVLMTGALATTLAAQPPGLEIAGSLAERAAADYRQQARYPEHSRALAAGDLDPVRAKRVPAPHSLAAGRSLSGLMLTVWAEEVSFQTPAPVVLNAAVTGGESAGLTVTGEVVDQSGASLGRVVYKDDGRGADEAAGDGTFTGVYTLPPGRVPELAESFLVKIEATAPNGEVARAAGGFLVSNPHAAVTGRFRDELRDGDLVLGVEVEVERAGRYHVSGTLTTMKGEPVGWAQAARQLEPGTHWLELSFFGLMFRDRGVAGPFRLASLSLVNASGMPNALVDLVEDAHVTRPLRLDAVRSTPFGDPQLLREAERLEAEAAQSRARAGGS